MKNGVLLFANNNNEIDYIKQAIFCETKKKNHMNLPVCLVTDSSEDLPSNYSKYFDIVIPVEKQNTTQQKRFRDGLYSEKIVVWKNHSRINAYDLTPFENTLVLDTDFIISNDILMNVFESNEDFMISKDIVDLKGSRNTDALKKLNDKSIDMYWATVFFFKKTHLTKTFFDLLKHIQENYDFYRLRYKIVETKYRNDFAFSIAIHMLRDYENINWPKSIPGHLWTTFDKDILVKLDGTKMHLLLEHESDYICATVKDVNVHVMNKFSLNRIIDEQF